MESDHSLESHQRIFTYEDLQVVTKDEHYFKFNPKSGYQITVKLTGVYSLNLQPK